jgi:hypothetical protein
MPRLLCLPLLLVCLGRASLAPVPEKSAKPAEQLLLEVSLPPPGAYEKGKEKLFQPALGKTSLTKYADRDEGQKKLRERIRQAQVLLWATSPVPAPNPLLTDVQMARKALKGSPVLVERLPIPTTPAAEKRLKEQILSTSKQLARVIAALEHMVEELKEVQEQRNRENPRWQANHDLVLAWLHHRIVYLEEYALALGSMRKEWPPHDAAIHKVWRLVSQEKQRDFAVRKRAREAEKLLQQLIKDHPDSVWADLAQQAMKMHLSVEWQPVK